MGPAASESHEIRALRARLARTDTIWDAIRLASLKKESLTSASQLFLRVHWRWFLPRLRRGAAAAVALVRPAAEASSSSHTQRLALVSILTRRVARPEGTFAQDPDARADISTFARGVVPCRYQHLVQRTSHDVKGGEALALQARLDGFLDVVGARPVQYRADISTSSARGARCGANPAIPMSRTFLSRAGTGGADATWIHRCR